MVRKVWNGSAWVKLDAANLDTVDGIHFRVNASKLEYSLNGTTWVVA